MRHILLHTLGISVPYGPKNCLNEYQKCHSNALHSGDMLLKNSLLLVFTGQSTPWLRWFNLGVEWSQAYQPRRCCLRLLNWKYGTLKHWSFGFDRIRSNKSRSMCYSVLKQIQAIANLFYCPKKIKPTVLRQFAWIYLYCQIFCFFNNR